MRLGLTLNSVEQYIASMPSLGYLSAHLNLSEHRKSGETKRKLRIVGHDTSSPTETISLHWPDVELAIGDVLELTLLEEGAGSPPESTRSSSENPSNLFSSTETAAEALAIGAEFEKRILEFLHKAESVEAPEEARKIRLAIGHLIAALYEHLHAPAWRRHPTLVPPEMQGELL